MHFNDDETKKKFINWCRFLPSDNNILIEDIDKLFEKNLIEYSKINMRNFSSYLSSGLPNRIRSLVWFISAKNDDKLSL